ncbi:hypothetical protein CCR95_24140 [Thiocystis minor]|nr:hypothetical protein [Thiocystis minor]
MQAESEWSIRADGARPVGANEFAPRMPRKIGVERIDPMPSNSRWALPHLSECNSSIPDAIPGTTSRPHANLESKVSCMMEAHDEILSMAAPRAPLSTPCR